MTSSPLPLGRARGRLQRARENGYLYAACSPELASLHGEWCWRLRIPVVWSERCSPRSRYGRVHFDLFTTPHSLTAAGREALTELAERFSLAGSVTVTAHDAFWDHVPFALLDDLAHAVQRAAGRPGNYQFDLPQPVPVPANRGAADVLPFAHRATA